MTAFRELKSVQLVSGWIYILAIFSIICALGNVVGYHYPFIDSLIGMMVLCIITIIGLLLEKILPYNIPSILYISVIGLIIAVPWSPISSFVVYYTSRVELVSLTTVLLAYAGIAMGKDIGEFRNAGVRGILVTFFVIIGTFLGSALIAQLVLTYTGLI